MGVAVVFGGAGAGSGSAIARRFAADFTQVVICDLDARETGAIKRAVFHRTDVSDRDQIAEAFAFAQTLGPVTAIVNNASAVDAFDEQGPLAHWDEFVSVDLLGALWSTRLGIDALRTGGGGAIVNVSSTSALKRTGGSGAPMYDVAKAAILHLTLRMKFLEAENIRVNSIVPHWIAVPHIIEYVNGLDAQQRKERGVPDRLIPVEEIAETVYRLATDTALAGAALVWPDGLAPRALSSNDF